MRDHSSTAEPRALRLMTKRTIVIGYGNPGRLDDGLGPALAERLERLAVPNVNVDSDYQLTVEDAALIADYDAVVFADASVNGPEPFSFAVVKPTEGDLSFSSHSIEPSAVVGMAHALFNVSTRAYALGIRGYTFNDFGEALSPKALHNLEQAVRFLEGAIRHDLLDDSVHVYRDTARSHMDTVNAGVDTGGTTGKV